MVHWRGVRERSSRADEYARASFVLFGERVCEDAPCPSWGEILFGSGSLDWMEEMLAVGKSLIRIREGEFFVIVIREKAVSKLDVQQSYERP